MTVIGLDDTDSRDLGMCTTYVAARIAGRVREVATVHRVLLIRLNPAVEFKTRGNAALAIHTDLDPEHAFDLSRTELEKTAKTEDSETNPGLVVASDDAASISESITDFAREAVRDHLRIEQARTLARSAGFRYTGWGLGRGIVGALAAIGAWSAFDEWTTEVISYREPNRWGTPRQVDLDSVFAAADRYYPAVWDTVDNGVDEAVCVPHTPGPVLHGIRGDDSASCWTVADSIDSEPVERRETFLTNQGTDAHLRMGQVGDLKNGRAYRVSGRVARSPTTERGGHVFFCLQDGNETARCAAFEPTKRFRDHVRALRKGDRITACGEVSDGTLKLEKFAVRELVRTELATPTCGSCGRRMESAGRGQGYRCRNCKTTAETRVEQPIDRDLELGWYEVPPCARRHIARPLIRGGFDAPIHPER